MISFLPFTVIPFGLVWFLVTYVFASKVNEATNNGIVNKIEGVLDYFLGEYEPEVKEIPVVRPKLSSAVYIEDYEEDTYNVFTDEYEDDIKF